MDIKDMAGVTIGAVIAVVLFAALLVPIVSDATATEKTYTNKGMFNAVSLDGDSAHTLSFDYTSPNILTVDDVDIDMSAIDSTYGSATVIFSGDWFMRYVPNSGIVLYKCGTSSSQAIKGATASSEISVTVTIGSGVATFAYSDSTEVEYNIADAGMMITSGKGDYVMKTASSKAYVNEDSIVYGIGRTDRALGTSGTSFNAMMSASIADGVTALYYSPQYNLNDDKAVTYTKNTTGKDLYELTGFTFNLVDNDSVEHPITYNQIFVPAEVTTELTTHVTDTESTLINVIPIMVVIGIILGVLGILYLRRE